MYKEQLPSMESFSHLVRLVGPFPASARRIAHYAKHFGFGNDTTHFLHLFHPIEIFESRADFINRCNELALIISEEARMPKEVLRSLQG